MKHHRVVQTVLLVGAFLVAVSPAFAAAAVMPNTSQGARMPLSVVDQQVSIKSPDGTIEMTVHAQGPLTYSVSMDGKTVLAQSALGLKFQDGVVLGADVQLAKVERNQSDTTWENKFGKRRTVRDRHNELKLSLVEKSGRPFEVIIRAFDDGIGFRYVLPATSSSPTQEFVLEEELTRFAFTENHLCFAGINENTGKPENPVGYIGSQESEYLPTHLADLPTDQVRMLPLLVKTDAAWVAITESDLFDWAGMWVNRVASAGAGVTLAARLSPRPDGQGLVKSSFPRNSPWRTLLIAREPGRLIESDLVLNLASPCVPADTSWVKPGIASWDWWSQVTRPSTATFKELIQFSAEMGWAYVLMDAGWSSRNSIMQGSPSVNMEELLAFAKEKNVRLWLWLHWSSVDRNDAYKEAFALYEKWGIAGVKIDFMNRDDQEMVNWYEKITKAAAEHHLMVNFHGAFKPTGMIRTYPNQITREGILGNEYNRWSARVTPEHKVTLPFTRMPAGPGDYTPGGFLNKQLDQFKFNVRPTQVQGTRCAELALFVCLESPVINASDHPSHYRDQPGLDFLKIVPTVWDDTRVLDGAVGEHVVIVRRNGDRWFLGALTDRNARDISVKLDFLGRGSWTMKLWKDAPDSDVEGTHLVIEQRSVTAADTLALHMALAGGAVACFEPVSQQAGSSVASVNPDAFPTGRVDSSPSRHPFLYAGQWDTRKPQEQSIFIVREGKIAWQYSIPLHPQPGVNQEFSDATLLSNGNVIFARMSGAAMVGPDKKLLWDYAAPPGTEIHSCQSIGRDRVLIMRNGNPAQAMIINTTTGTIEKEIPIATTVTGTHGQFRHIRMTRAGTLLVPHLGEGKVVEYSLDGAVLWSVPAKSPWHAVRLKNGHTLIAGDWSRYAREVTPEGKTVWEFTQADVPGQTLGNIQTAARLANGNTVLCCWIAGDKDISHWPGTVQVFEVTPEKRVVWALSSWRDPDLGPATNIQLLDEPGATEDAQW